MPRDSNGTYSLPAGNPVVTLTPISSTWANTTLDDIGNALTDSLDRAGSGAMTGQLKLANGTAGAPALTWGTDTTSGLYRAAANDFRFSVASADKLTITSALISTSVPFGLPNGAAATPALYFTSDTDTGIYRIGVNSFGIAAGGVLVSTFESTLVQSEFVHRFVDGAAATPGITFSADSNTGIYRIGADSIGVSTNGTLRVTVNTANLTTTLAILGPDGAVGAPAYSFSSDTDLGFYRAAADIALLVANGAESARWSTQGVGINNGSAASPSLSFSGDTNTGIYRIAADQLGFTEGGTGYRIGFRGVPTNAQNAGYTFVAEDVGKQVTANTAGTFTVPPSVFAAGDVLTFINTTGSNCTIAQGAGVTHRLLGTAATTGNRTVASFGMATIIAQNSTVFLVGGPGVS